MKLIKYCLITIIKSILWFLDSDHRTHDTICDDNVKKFTHVESAAFESDFGKTTRVVRTIPYSLWELKTTTKTLRGADRHLVIRENREPVWIENLCVGDMILTQDGPEEVLSVRSLGVKTHMYCMQVETEKADDPNNHLFYSNGILSHNTTTASAYLLWHAMFKSDQTILVVANVFRAATEIMHRIRTMYESCPDHIRAGVKAFNKTSIEFDNGSRIVSQATTPNAGRGMSLNLLFVDEMAFCAPNIIEAMWTSLSPTLAATQGKSIITSTPKTDVDMFAKLWFGANDITDEFGNHDPKCKNGEGKNGYYPVIATWDKNPTRTKEWAEAEEAKIGKAKFAQEHNCIVGQSLVNIEGIGSVSIEDLYKMLGEQS